MHGCVNDLVKAMYCHFVTFSDLSVLVNWY